MPKNVSPVPCLSVSMIVRDEQDVLAASLESVQLIADEIVILDTGSTDQTIAIARRFGAKVYELPWPHDYAAARNHCLQRVSGDWILWLDAGERLTPDSAGELRRFIDAQPAKNKVYSLWIEIPPRDGVGYAEQALCTRLMPRRADLRFKGRIRETLQPSMQVADIGTAVAPGRILRHPRQHDLTHSRKRAQNALSLARMEAKELGKSPPRLLLATAQAHAMLGALDEARSVFRQAIAAAEQNSKELLEAYYGLIATFEGDAEHHEAQLAGCLEALEIFPLDAQLLLAMGNCLLTRERLDLAIRSFDGAFRLGQVTSEVWHSVAVKEMAALYLSLTLQCAHRDAEARQVLEAALGDGHGTLNLKERLLDLYMKLGETDLALALADQIPMDADQRDPVRDAIRGACRAARQDWTSALGYLQCAYLSGCRSVFCLRWLAVTLLSNGEVEAARPVLDEWRLIEPENAELRAYLAAIAGYATEGSPSSDGTSAASHDRSPGRQVRIDSVQSPAEGVPHSASVTSPNATSVRSPHR